MFFYKEMPYKDADKKVMVLPKKRWFHPVMSELHVDGDVKNKLEEEKKENYVTFMTNYCVFALKGLMSGNYNSTFD